MISINNRQQIQKLIIYLNESLRFLIQKNTVSIEDTELICFDCAEAIQNQIDSMMLQNEDLEDSLTSVKRLFRRSFEQVRYNPDSKFGREYIQLRTC